MKKHTHSSCSNFDTQGSQNFISFFRWIQYQINSLVSVLVHRQIPHTQARLVRSSLTQHHTWGLHFSLFSCFLDFLANALRSFLGIGEDNPTKIIIHDLWFQRVLVEVIFNACKCLVWTFVILGVDIVGIHCTQNNTHRFSNSETRSCIFTGCSNVASGSSLPRSIFSLTWSVWAYAVVIWQSEHRHCKTNLMLHEQLHSYTPLDIVLTLCNFSAK